MFYDNPLSAMPNITTRLCSGQRAQFGRLSWNSDVRSEIRKITHGVIGKFDAGIIKQFLVVNVAGDRPSNMPNCSFGINDNLGFDGFCLFLARISRARIPSFGSLFGGINDKLQDFIFPQICFLSWNIKYGLNNGTQLGKIPANSAERNTCVVYDRV